MILIIEGHRHSGKSYLIDKFIKQCEIPNVHYYKFQFAKYIEDLGIRDQEDGPGVHYFSISNVMTIFELNQTLLSDKVLVFDRAIFSAYVWSIYRERMEKGRLLTEFERLLLNKIYDNVTVVYVNREESVGIEKREDKDYFGNFENADAEKEIFEEIFARFDNLINDPAKRNRFTRFTNHFDEISCEAFNSLLTDLINNRTVS
jgi:thymidylate kinase